MKVVRQSKFAYTIVEKIQPQYEHQTDGGVIDNGQHGCQGQIRLLLSRMAINPQSCEPQGKYTLDAFDRLENGF